MSDAPHATSDVLLVPSVCHSACGGPSKHVDAFDERGADAAGSWWFASKERVAAELAGHRPTSKLLVSTLEPRPPHAWRVLRRLISPAGARRRRRRSAALRPTRIWPQSRSSSRGLKRNGPQRAARGPLRVPSESECCIRSRFRSLWREASASLVGGAVVPDFAHVAGSESCGPSAEIGKSRRCASRRRSGCAR